MNAWTGTSTLDRVPLRPIAAPDPEQARLLRQQFDLQLLDSLLYITERAGLGLGQPVSAQLERLADIRNRLSSVGRLRAVAYTMHTELAHALREGDSGRTAALISHLTAVRFTAEGTRVVSVGAMDPDEEALLFATLARENEREYRQRFDARPPDPTYSLRAINAAEYTLEVLAHEDPPTAAEVDILVSELVIMGSDLVNAGTSSRAFGYVLLRELGKERAWTTYLENIVHEASHLYLYTLFLADPILEGDGERRYRSPLRREGRPLSAVLHAAFVLARTARIVRLLGSRSAFRDDIESMSTSYNAAANPESFELKFGAAWETLRKEATFTPFGEEFLADCRRIALAE